LNQQLKHRPSLCYRYECFFLFSSVVQIEEGHAIQFTVNGGDRKTFEVMTSTGWIGTHGSDNPLLAEILYQLSISQNH
jgi:hypothetical protein